MLLRRLGIWRKREDGVVAVEFAMISLPFFIMLMGIVETGLFFATSITIEGGVAEASRMIRTGQLEDVDDPEAAFMAELCDQVDEIMNCDDLQYEVVTIGDGSFASAESYEPVFDADGNLVSSGFDAGGSEDVVLIFVVHRYSFLTPFIGNMMTGNMGQDTAIITSLAVIRNEPYEFGV